MTKSINDKKQQHFSFSSFRSCLHSEESTIEHDVSAVIQVTHELHHEYDKDEVPTHTIDNVNSGNHEWHSPDLKSMRTKQELRALDVSPCDVAADDVFSQNELDRCGLVVQLDMMHADEAYFNCDEFPLAQESTIIPLAQEDNTMLSSDHQSIITEGKSSDVDLAKFCNLIITTDDDSPLTQEESTIVSLAQDENTILSSDHQSTFTEGKSSEVDLVKLCNLITTTDDHSPLTQEESTIVSLAREESNIISLAQEESPILSSNPQSTIPKGKSSEIDLVKLCNLITTTSIASQYMYGKDVLVLLGTTGSGKTSTMLYLCGVTFKETDDEDYEIESFPSSNPELKRFKISDSSRSCTRCLQTSAVTYDSGRTVILCDAPGFGDTEGIEYDIANGIVMIQALRRAKSVKPVLVFNKGWQYDRFVSLTDTLQAVLRITGQKESIDFSAFQFVFTGCTKRDAKSILKKFRLLLKEIESTDHPHHSILMIAMVNAMINEISSMFLYVDLEDDESSTLLSQLLNDSKPKVTNPVTFFSPYVSEKADIILSSELRKSMSDIDKCFSNNLYCQALPLISQMIQVCNVIQIAEHTVAEGTNIQRLLHKLFERFCYHLSKIFSYTSESKNCVLMELNKLTKLNACVNLFHENTTELNTFTHQVESHMCHLLEADKIININSNPTEWAWKIVRLGKLSAAANSYPFLDGISRQCNKSVDQIDDHVCEQLEIMSSMVQFSIGGLADIRQYLININSFSAKVVEFGSFTPTKYIFHEKIYCFWNNFRTRLAQVSDNLRVFSDKIEKATVAKNYFAITSRTIIDGGDLRGQLISTLGTEDWFQILQNNRCHFQPSLTNEFDERLISWMSLTHEALELEVNRYDIWNNSDMDFAALEETKSIVRERLQDFQNVCSKAQTWQQFEKVQIHDFLNNIIKIHTLFESYAKDIDEQNKQLVENCRKGYMLASDFSNRLRSGKEEIANLLSELDEPSSWDSWSILVNEKKDNSFFNGVYSRFKNVLGLNAENIKLKKMLDDIVHVLKQSILYRFQKLVSVEIDTSRPIEAATYILQKRQEDVMFVVVLVNLRTESTLHEDLIDKDVRQVLSRSLSFLSDSFKKISQFPATLVANHHFDKAGELLSIWKASNELLRHLRSFSNAPLLQDFNGCAKELQNIIQDCQGYESIVDLFFNEIKKIQSEVESMSFDCAYGGVHEKNKFYGKLLQLLQAVRGFEIHKNHAISQDYETLLNIESIMLSKFSTELEQMGCHFLKLMDKFLDDSSCLKRVNSLMLNLDCIEQIFKKTGQSISRQVCEIKSSAEELLEMRFAQMNESIDLDCSKSILELLILWKRAGYEVQSWRSLFDKQIDLILNEICQKKTSSVPLALSILLRSVEGADAVVANLLLSEHSIFEGSMNVVFDEKTASQDIKYVLRELSSLSESEKMMLEGLYVSFETSYLNMLEEGLCLLCCDENRVNDPTSVFFKSKAEAVMKDYDVKYSNQVCELTAVLFARWSIMSNEFLFQKITTADERRYLKKPHPAQVVAIWLMLNLLHDDFAVIKNVLVELKTGEGKSVVLGITGTILALFGLHVDCVCYSTFLSCRDYDDFEHLFECFNVLDRIRYGTVITFVEEMLPGHEQKVASVVNGRVIGSESSVSTNMKSRILLIDEVDVFFGEDLFGGCDLPAISLSGKTVQEVFYSAWGCSDGLQSLNYQETIQKLLRRYPKDSRKLIKRLVADLLNEASQVKNELTSEFFVVNNEIVKKHFDGVCGYSSNEISFRYIKHAESGEIPKAIADKNLDLSIAIGSVSCAELPFEYTAIIGVTGTLRGLGDSSQDILINKYGMEKYYYVPSVFGTNRLSFSCESLKDVIIGDSEADFHLELKQEILTRRRSLQKGSNEDRPVMVFFRSKQALTKFFDSTMMKQLKDVTNIVDETMSKEIRGGLFLKATERGSITLMIRDFGRGTDFKCFDPSVLHEGGVHVIQAFFSIDLSEETQIKGRTARQGANGSFSMVINAIDLCKDFSLTPNAITSLKNKGAIYTSLHELRVKKTEDTIASRLKKVEESKDLHYRTIACYDDLNSGKGDEVLSFLEELEGGFQGSAFKNNNKKEERGNQRQLRLRMISEEDKGKRLSKICTYSDKEKVKFEKARVREMMKVEGSNHYQILGIPKESLHYQIQNAIRSLSKIFHPDKCPDDDALTIMQRLNTIKDEFACEKVRKKYDDQLN